MLNQILVQKQKEVEEMKCKKRSFIALLKESETLVIIAEVKRASPSKGDLNRNVDVAKQGKSYEQYGASAISVLTDSTFFKGSFADLQAVRNEVDIPVLCKEFIVDEIQLYKAKEIGADIVLLIVAALTPEKLAYLYSVATSIGLEVIVEVHDEEELNIALTISPEIIGINNRNLKTFEVSLRTTEQLATKAKEHGAYVISESGIRTKEDALRVKKAGVDGILVGETFMIAASLEEAFAELKV